MFTWVQCCPIAIDGGDGDADGETVHAADTAGSAATFWGAMPAPGWSPGRSASGGAGQDCLTRAAAGLVWPLSAELTDEALEQILFPARSKPGARRYVEPDWPVLVREMKRPGVNLSVLFEEYRAVYPDGYAYSRFCQLYRAFEQRLSPTMRQTHVAGDRRPLTIAAR